MRKFEIVTYEMRKHKDVEIILPIRATKSSAGYDIYSPVNMIIVPNNYHLFWTDVKVCMNQHEVFTIVPRSGLEGIFIIFLIPSIPYFGPLKLLSIFCGILKSSHRSPSTDFIPYIFPPTLERISGTFPSSNKSIG